MRCALTAVLISFAVAPVAAQTIHAPPLTPGDTWTYADSNAGRVTHDVVTLVRADKSLIAVEVHSVGGAPGREVLFGANWSRVRSVDGRQTVVNQPLSYPMAPGKTWTVAFDETNPSNRAHTREGWHMVMKAVGWEDVTVPAGTFRALRIEGDGTWTADLPSNTLTTLNRTPNGGALATRTNQGARVISGRFMRAFWYVPEVRRWVKSEEDIYDTNGVRSSHVTADLEAYAMVEGGSQIADTPAPDAPHRPRHAHVRHHAPAVPVPTAQTPVAPHRPAKPTPAVSALPPLQETRVEGIGVG